MIKTEISLNTSMGVINFAVPQKESLVELIEKVLPDFNPKVLQFSATKQTAQSDIKIIVDSGDLIATSTGTFSNTVGDLFDFLDFNPTACYEKNGVDGNFDLVLGVSRTKNHVNPDMRTYEVSFAIVDKSASEVRFKNTDNVKFIGIGKSKYDVGIFKKVKHYLDSPDEKGFPVIQYSKLELVGVVIAQEFPNKELEKTYVIPEGESVWDIISVEETVKISEYSSAVLSTIFIRTNVNSFVYAGCVNDRSLACLVADVLKYKHGCPLITMTKEQFEKLPKSKDAVHQPRFK